MGGERVHTGRSMMSFGQGSPVIWLSGVTRCFPLPYLLRPINWGLSIPISSLYLFFLMQVSAQSYLFRMSRRDWVRWLQPCASYHTYISGLISLFFHKPSGICQSISPPSTRFSIRPSHWYSISQFLVSISNHYPRLSPRILLENPSSWSANIVVNQGWLEWTIVVDLCPA